MKKKYLVCLLSTILVLSLTIVSCESTTNDKTTLESSSLESNEKNHIPDYTAWGIITHLHNIGINPFDFDGNIIYSEDIINEYGAGLFIGSCTEDLEIFINDQKTSYDKLQIGMIVKLYVRNGVIEDSFPQTIYNVCKIEAYTDMNQ